MLHRGHLVLCVTMKVTWLQFTVDLKANTCTATPLHRHVTKNFSCCLIFVSWHFWTWQCFFSRHYLFCLFLVWTKLLWNRWQSRTKQKRTKNISAATEQTPFMVFGDRSGKTFRKAVFLLFLSRTTRVCNCFYSIIRRISFHKEFCEVFVVVVFVEERYIRDYCHIKQDKHGVTFRFMLALRLRTEGSG